MARVQYRLNYLFPDTKYVLRMRGRVQGSWGPWSNRLEYETTVDEMPPGPPQNFELEYDEGQFVLSWDPPTTNEDGSPLTDLSDYVLTVINLSNAHELKFEVYASPFSFDIDLLRYMLGGELSGSVRFELRARDRVGNESEPASVEFEATPPAPFNMLTAVGVEQAVVLTWEVAEDDDLSHYEIFRNGVLVGRTIGTELEYIDGNPGPAEVEYYVVAVDAFGLRTESSNKLRARALGYWQGDTEAPAIPTHLNVSSRLATNNTNGSTAEATVSFRAPTVNTNGEPYEDWNEFSVEWSREEDGPWQRGTLQDDRIEPGTTKIFEYVVNNLQSGVTYWFRVAAIDRYGNRSAYAKVAHVTAGDTIAPSRPAAPTAAGGMLRVQVSHNLNKWPSGKLEDDVRRLDVYIGTELDFEPTASTYVGSIETLAPSTGFSAVQSFSVPNDSYKYVKVIAVDVSGNRSDASPVADASGLTLVNAAYIEKASITDAEIYNLSASKLIAGTGFINNLFIGAALNIEEDGLIKSSNYVHQEQGFLLTDQFLEINDGVISASALTLSTSANLLPWAYGSFENPLVWYLGGTDAEGNPQVAQLGISAEAQLSTIEAVAWEGERSLRFRSKETTTSANRAEIWLAPAAQEHNILNVRPGERYIVSTYVRPNTDMELRFKVQWNAGAPISTVTRTLTPSTYWQRVHAVFTAPPNVSAMTIGFDTGTANADTYMDALQVELVTTPADSAVLEPNVWRPATQTTIDGGQIRTGEIMSNNYTASTGWRIGMEGNATFWNAFLRGNIQAVGGFLQNLSVYDRLTVGSAANDLTSRIQSYNGNWYLRGDGYLYAQNANIRGTIDATNGTFQNVSTISMDVGVSGSSLGYIKSANFNGSTSGSGTGTAGWIIRNAQSSGFQAVFHNAYIRGHLVADDIETGTLSGINISGVNITGSVIQTVPHSTQGYIRIQEAGGINFYARNPTTGSNVLTSLLYARRNITETSFLKNALYTSAFVADNIEAAIGLYTAGLVTYTATISSSLNVGEIRASGSAYIEMRNAVDLNNNSLNGASVVYSRAFIQTAPNEANHFGVIRAPAGKADVDFTSRIEMNGNDITEVGNLTYQSSESLKHSIADATGMLTVIRELRPVEYQFIEREGKHYGLIAEEVHTVDEALSTGTAINLNNLVGVLVGATRELDAEQRALAARVDKIEEWLETVETTGDSAALRGEPWGGLVDSRAKTGYA